MTFDYMNTQRVPHCINKPSLVPIGLQLFKWGHFHIFSPSYNLTSDDLWSWQVTFDLINKWGFPCCIYDPTLVETHQSMWKVEPNVNLFSQQTTDNNSGQSGLCVFTAKAGDTKILPRWLETNFPWYLKFALLSCVKNIVYLQLADVLCMLGYDHSQGNWLMLTLLEPLTKYIDCLEHKLTYWLFVSYVFLPWLGSKFVLSQALNIQCHICMYTKSYHRYFMDFSNDCT